MEAFANYITQRPMAILAVIAGLTLGAFLQIVDPQTMTLRLRVDPSIDRLLPEDDDERRYYEYVRRLFGSDETMMVAILNEDVFRFDHLSLIDRLTTRIGAVPGVHHVSSLANALNVRSSQGDIEVAPYFDRPPRDELAQRTLRAEVLGNPLYEGNLVSSDGRASLLFVHLRNLPERALIEMGVVESIERIVMEERGSVNAFLTGGLHAKSENSRLMLEDITRTLPLAILVSVLVSWIAFRSLRGLLVPVATVAISVIWTLGFVSAIGVSLNLLTVILPTLLLVVGFAYSVHLISEYDDALERSERDGTAKSGVAAAAMREVAMPLIVTAGTTAAGLLALTTSPIGAIKQFGAFATLGVILTVVASLTFAPAVLALLPTPTHMRPRAFGGRFDRLAAGLARFDFRNRRAIIVVSYAVAAIAILGITRIRVSTEFIEAGSALHRGAVLLNEHLQGANSFYVVVESDEPGRFTDPATLAELQNLHSWLEAQPEIGGVSSLIDYLKVVNRGFNEGDDAHLIVPESARLVSQLLFFGASDDLERFVDTQRRSANIHVRSTVNDSHAMAALLARIEERASALPGSLRTTVTGNTVLVTHTLDRLARGQAISLAFAFAMIFAVLSLLFTSVRSGFLALIPNALPVVFYFGVLGFGGITLNSTTSLVACLVLGIAVDDSIHLLARFSSAAKAAADERKGIVDALRVVARPVTFTTAALCLGFLALTTSHFHNQVQFGALAALTLAFAWLIDITFTPALATSMHIVSLWDVLTLDLGRDPHRSIPLLKGMRLYQARITALTTSIVEYPKGHRLFSAGDSGDEMFVIIEGQVRATLSTERGTLTFATHQRGDVIGEVALFHGVRTADATAETDVRMLRLTRDNLERLARRHPRVAARLYVNLSETLAHRVATTTRHVR
jgi:predicted RND superfamily exporter protein